jgi:hypothetical protein
MILAFGDLAMAARVMSLCVRQVSRKRLHWGLRIAPQEMENFDG